MQSGKTRKDDRSARTDVGAVLGTCRLGHFIALTLDAHTVFLPLRLGRVWKTGQILTATLRRLRLASDGGGGICEGSDGQAYFLRQTQGLHEGQHVSLKVLGEPRGGKSALAAHVADPPSINLPEQPALKHTLGSYGVSGAIEVQGLDLLARVRAAYPQDRFVLGAAQSHWGERADDALEIHTLARDQVRLICEATQTAHHIDVDGQGQAEMINATAREMAVSTIIERNLGGLIFIDFIALLSKAARRDLCARIEQGLSALPHRVKVHPMNESGHVIIERQRLGPEFLATYFR